MFRSALAFGAVALSMLLLPAPPVAGQTAKLVWSDLGGSLGARQSEIRELRRSGRRVELRGTCHSACTMYLSLPNACVDPAADFGFHGPQGLLGPLPRDVFEHWSEVMSRDLRQPLRDWFMTKARHQRSGVLRVSGVQMIGMGYPRC